MIQEQTQIYNRKIYKSFSHCGHITWCKECIDFLLDNSCPLCRTPMRDYFGINSQTDDDFINFNNGFTCVHINNLKKYKEDILRFFSVRFNIIFGKVFGTLIYWGMLFITSSYFLWTFFENTMWMVYIFYGIFYRYYIFIFIAIFGFYRSIFNQMNNYPFLYLLIYNISTHIYYILQFIDIIYLLLGKYNYISNIIVLIDNFPCLCSLLSSLLLYIIIGCYGLYISKIKKPNAIYIKLETISTDLA